MDDHDPRVIDLASYLKRKEEASSRERTTFALWGAEGERSRFALPLWRSAYLAGGRRAALLWHPPGAAAGRDPVEPLVVLDLAEDPARVAFAPTCLSGLDGVEQPGTVVVSPHGLAVYLGEEEARKWYLAVDDVDEPLDEIKGRTRDDLLFLAGECAGLLFHKGLSEDPGSE